MASLDYYDTPDGRVYDSNLFRFIARGEPVDCPPPGYHYDPYAKMWRKNLTDAEVQNLWPYAGPTSNAITKKETPMEPVTCWLEDTLTKAGIESKRTDELHEAPAPQRYLKGDEGDAAARGEKVTSMRVPKEKVAELVEATAFINEVVSTGDNVHLPKHYARYKIEPIRFSIENELDGFQFNIIKYVCRHPYKNKREDLMKALRYLEMYIKYTYDKDPDWWK